MRDPDLQPAIDLGFYSARSGPPQYPRDSMPGLVKSLNKAHDNLKSAAKLITELEAEFRAYKRDTRIKLWVMGSAIVALTTFVGWLIDWFR